MKSAEEDLEILSDSSVFSASSMRRPARVKGKTPVLAGFSCRLVADQREAHAALVFVGFPS
jgi:hypothetical protein